MGMRLMAASFRRAMSFFRLVENVKLQWIKFLPGMECSTESLKKGSVRYWHGHLAVSKSPLLVALQLSGCVS